MKSRLTTALLAGTSAMIFALPAFAQDQAAAADDQAASETIIVTGSRIVRDGYTAPTPVTVAAVEELVKATPTNIPDALNKLPQFQNSLSPARSANNFSNLPIHGNMLNLRGLGTPTNNPKGPLRTLVLFDGVRVSPTTYVGTVDTNVLPNLLVQRVDVVTGGASAAWGSDAVAGVVNFVLDRNFTGLKGQIQAGIDQRGDNANQRIGVAYGTKFSGDRGHFLASAEYYNNDGMLRSARASGRGGYAFVGGTVGCTNPNPTTDPTACSPGGSRNPYVIGEDVRLTAVYETGKITGSSVGASFPLLNYVFNADGTYRPFANGTTTGTSSTQLGGDGYRIPDDTAAVAPYKTYQTFSRLSYDLTDDVNVFAQGVFSRQDMSYRGLANSLVTPVNLYKGNPYLPAAIDALLPTANDYITVTEYNAKGPKPLAKERTDFWSATAGVDGNFGGFKASLSYNHSESTHKMSQSGLYDWKKLYAAVDVVSVNGTPTCRVLTDATVSAQYTGCSPINVIKGDPSVTTPQGYAYATGTSRYEAKTQHDSVAFNINGSVFDLPAGPVDVALGAEYRKQSLKLTSNADPAALDTTAERNAYFAGLRGLGSGVLFYWLTNVGVADGSLNVKEVYGEAAVPLLKGITGFQELSVNGAVRVTDYSFSGTVTTWKFGTTWKPVDDLLLRGSYSRDIRAPNLFELYRGDTSGIGIVLDPVTGINQNIPNISGGNRNLKPETAKTLTLGGVFSPSGLPGFSMSVDYYRINLKGAIDALSSQQIVNNCYIFGAATPECALITRPSANAFPTQIRITEANISYLKTSGVDLDASYRTELGNDSAVNLRLYVNYLDKFDTQLYAGQPIAHYAGVNVVGSNPVAYPHWRGNFSVDYSKGNFGVTLSEQFIGGMRLGIPASPANQNFNGLRVNPIVYTDLSVRYTIPQGAGNIELFGTINNLLDKDPPLIPGITPGVNLPTNISTYDMIGRAFTAGARFKF